MDLDEDTYSVIFSALKHPSRRKILRILAEGPNTYTELQNKLGIDTGYLNYYLDSLDGLIIKNERGYSLSELGRAALTLIHNVEEISPKIGSRDLKILGLKLNILHISLLTVTMLILSNAYCIYVIHTQNLERAELLENSISFTRALLNESIEIINRTIRENRIFSSNYNIISIKLLQASNQLDLIKILDVRNSKYWSQLALATNSLAEFFAMPPGVIYIEDYPYMDITVGQGWETLLSMLMSDLMEIEKSLPTKVGLGGNLIVEIEDEHFTKVFEAAFKLQEDIALARRTLGSPEKISIEVKEYRVEIKRK